MSFGDKSSTNLLKVVLMAKNAEDARGSVKK